jgi:hypothetical protein
MIQKDKENKLVTEKGKQKLETMMTFLLKMGFLAVSVETRKDQAD